MSDPFLGEIRMMANNFAPRNWAYCSGQLLSISQNTALFSLLGTTYGGDGRTSFALPDLRGRVPIHEGSGVGLPSYSLGQRGGEETVTLNVNQLPAHSHTVRADTNNTQQSPFDHYIGQLPFESSANGVMGSESIGLVGGGQSHQNMQPFLTIGFCIALAGIYPSRN